MPAAAPVTSSDCTPARTCSGILPASVPQVAMLMFGFEVFEPENGPTGLRTTPPAEAVALELVPPSPNVKVAFGLATGLTVRAANAEPATRRVATKASVVSFFIDFLLHISNGTTRDSSVAWLILTGRYDHLPKSSEKAAKIKLRVA